MNKKGQIPIVMLFVVALALVITALMSFASFNRAFDDQSIRNSKLMVSVGFGEQYCFESVKYAAKKAIKELKEGENLKEKFRSLLLEKNIGLSETGNFFRKVNDNEFKFEKLTDNLYHFEMAGIIADAGGKESNIIRQFNLCMEFDKNGEFVKRCLASYVSQ
ncbi:MAG: hypothetical protein QXD13_02125 [Candidatus Pacearchaeota archaeon]